MPGLLHTGHQVCVNAAINSQSSTGIHIQDVIFFKLKHSWFTVFYQSLRDSKMMELYTIIILFCILFHYDFEYSSYIPIDTGSIHRILNTVPCAVQ